MTLLRLESSFNPFPPRAAGTPTGDNNLILAETQIEVLAALNIAAALIDQRGDVRILNELAETLLGSDIVIRHRKLTAADTSSNRRLQELYAAIDAERPVSELSPVVVLRRDRRPLLVTALLSVRRADIARGNFVMLLLTDPDIRPKLNCVVLQAAFGLTDAEAHLARLLAVGVSLESAATKLGVTKGTASQRLKSIFAKTETHRQGELVSLLLSLI